jgi:hypothetical protein
VPILGRAKPLKVAAHKKHWINRSITTTAIPNTGFKVQMGPAGVSRRTDIRNPIPLLNEITALHPIASVMAVHGHKVVTSHNYDFAISPIRLTGEYDLARMRRKYLTPRRG